GIARAVHGGAGRGRARVRRPRRAAPAALDRPARAPALHRVLVRRRFAPARTLAVRGRPGGGWMDEADVVSVSGRDSGLGIRSSKERGGFSESRIPNPQSRQSIGPQRIVCLTEEPTEVLYALGEQDRIVGISGFTVRPPRARKEKPKVSAFTSAKIDEILQLEPDFVVGFSDIQADIAAELGRHGVEVWVSNHRSVAGIVDSVRRLGALVG